MLLLIVTIYIFIKTIYRTLGGAPVFPFYVCLNECFNFNALLRVLCLYVYVHVYIHVVI